MRQFFLVPVRRGLAAVALAFGASAAMAHGDVVPQAVDTSSLPQLGPKWKESNPYSSGPARKEALRIGSSLQPILQQMKENLRAKRYA